MAWGRRADLDEDRRLVTVLFADLSGSTPLAERLDPEDLRRVLASLFAALSREIQRFGGTLDKYIGDAVMAVFGAPVAHEDDAERAIRAGLAMQTVIRPLNEELQRTYGAELALRIGINTGEVVAGLLAGEVQEAYTVVGDTVNTAQRFEVAAPPGSILVGPTTRELARLAFAFEALPPRVLKGKAEPQAAFRVLGPHAGGAAPADVPLVGREAELERLRGALRAAAAGRGGCVHVVGEAGIGKSRLVREAQAGLRLPVQQVLGRCLSFEVDQPYALLARLLRELVHMPAGSDEAAARGCLEQALGCIRPRVDPLDTALLLEVLGYGQRSAIDPRSRQQALLHLVRRLLEAPTRQHPLLIVAEDLHWIDTASAALLAGLGQAVVGRCCLLLSTSRPSWRPPWPAEVIALEALPPAAARALVRAAFAAPVEDALVETILARTGGNPFCVEEVVRDLRAADMLVDRDGQVTARPGITPRLPSTVQEVLEARVGRLPPRARRVLHLAAVCGRVFRQRVLERLLEDVSLAECLDLLEREHFIVRQAGTAEPTYAFRHALIQEVAYHAQLHSQRRVTHTAVGAALEALYSDHLDELVGDLAFHYGRGDADAKAVSWLVRAGDRARALFANTEALAQYAAALERAAAGEAPLSSSAILERIGDVQMLTGPHDAALASFASALARLPAAPDARLAARLHRKTGTTLLLRGAYAEAAGAFERGLVALGPRADDPEAARIEVQIGHLAYRRGEYAAAHAALMAAVETATRLGVDDVSAAGLKLLGLVALQTREPAVAAEYMQRSQALYERLGDIGGVADIHSNLGMIHRRAGNADAALAAYQTSLALRERMGHLWGIGTCHNNLAEVHRTRGDLELAIRGYLRAIETWSAIGNASGVAVALIGLGAARVEQGEVARGRADLQEAEARLAKLGSTFYLPDLHRHLAAAALAAGDLDAAEVAAGRSLSYAQTARARHQEAATLRVLAEIALARQEADAAGALLEISRRTLQELGDMPELARTEAAIRRLGA